MPAHPGAPRPRDRSARGTEGAVPVGAGTGRPRLHFTPTTGWINDPHGPVHHEGRYHLFFQHVPGRAEWAHGVHWGHAVSEDLVRWVEQPVALSPGDGDDGIWSGSIVTSGDGARAFYTAVRHPDTRLGGIRIARPTDPGWTVWRKGDRVVAPPAHLDLAEFRDPCVVHDGGTWRMVLGGGTTDGTALALSWTSPDLEVWTPDGVLASRSTRETAPTWTGAAWECPQLVRVDGRRVLLVSVWAGGIGHHEAYAVGDVVEGRFLARTWRRLSHGPGHYAATAFTDRDGRACLLHWLRGVSGPGGRWAGALSVPHALRLDGDRLVVEPHPAVAHAVEDVRPGSTRRVGDTEVLLAGEELTVRSGRGAFTMPCAGGPVRILADPPIVEVFGPEGVAGFVTSAPQDSLPD